MLEKIQKGLHCDLEEAKNVLEYDKMVDHSKDSELLEFDLTKEEKKIAGLYTKVGTRTVTEPTKPRNKKDNPVKAKLITDIFTFLSEKTEIANLQIANPERMVTFQIGDSKFEITLIQKRK